jgi:transposase InsO family protein
MVQQYPERSIGYYCTLFGKSRQGYHLQQREKPDVGLQHALVLELVAEKRGVLGKTGADKLLEDISGTLKELGIKMGRDAFYDLLRTHGLLIRRKKRKGPKTTDSEHPYRKYPNLIKEMLITRAGQLWASDITYLRLHSGFSYLSLITDLYSHKIVGYKLHRTLHAKGCLDALEMALKDTKRTKQLIHHSDRGVQYCCQEYVSKIHENNISLSMTENGDPYENAVAERVNGILKVELGLGESFASFAEADAAVERAIRLYNNLRKHDSCDRITPSQAHEMDGVLKKRWKPRFHKKAPILVDALAL